MRPTRLLSLALAAALALCACPQPQGPAAPPPLPPTTRLREPTRTWKQPRAVVVRHARVLPAAGPHAEGIDDGAVLFEGGRIVAVGPSAEVAAPAGAEELDARGQVLTPGVIDAHSHLGVYATPETFSTEDGNEATAPVTAEVDARHAFWPQDPGLRRAAAGGVTALLALPGSANLIGGRGFPVKLHFGRTADEVRFPGAKDALKMACGENPRRVYGKERKQSPQTRMGNAAGYRQAFAHARDYLARWEDWQRRVQHVKAGETPPLPPARDLRLETLAGVLRGEILVQNHCYRADEMQTMIDIADEFGYRIRAFHHALEAYKIRDLLAKREIASATWADWFGFKLEAWDGIPWNAGLLQSAGARVAIHSDSPDGIQRLNQEAAKALARAREAGLSVSETEALRWFTLDPAWVLGVDDQTGSLEPGKMADLVLWDRTPLSVYARAQRVWADGVVTYDARTGPVEPSDFEAGEPAATWARLTPHPAEIPQLPSSPLAQPLPVEEAACTAISGATVLVDGAPQAPAFVVISGGRIDKLVPAQAALAEPPGCRRVDGTGLVLAPGFIEPSTSAGLAEIPAEESTSDVGPRRPLDNTPIHAALRAADSVNPASVLLPIARMGGVTALVSAPSGGLVPGQSAVLDTAGALLKPAAALHLRLGRGGHDALGSTRGAALQLVRELLDDAREYGKRRGDFEKNQMRKVAASRLDLEALQDALSGRLPVVIEANRVSDLRAALQLARDYQLRAILRGAAEAWQIAAELAQARVPVILSATADLPGDFDSLSSRNDAAALLAAAGVKLLLTTEGPDKLRTLPQEAGNAVAWGLPHAEAIRAISSNVADAYGLPTGRVQPGARADLVLWSGDPLELSSRPLALWLGGRQVTLQNRQHALLEKYRTLPAP